MQKQVVGQIWPVGQICPAGHNLRPPELEHVTQKYFLNLPKSEYFFEFVKKWSFLVFYPRPEDSDSMVWEGPQELIFSESPPGSFGFTAV